MLVLGQARRNLSDRALWLADEGSQGHCRSGVSRARNRVSPVQSCRVPRPETGAHILRMAHSLHLIGKGLGFADRRSRVAAGAAPMHDLGKVGIADKILLKPGRLDLRIRDHEETRGFWLRIAARQFVPWVLQAGAEIALAHHEKFDGSGYPQGLKGQDIPLFDVSLRVADVFDAFDVGATL